MADHLSGIIERLDLDAIEARANAAMSGPWVFDCENFGQHTHGGLYWALTGAWNDAPGIYINATLNQRVSLSRADIDQVCFSNADFIAHARTDIPALIAEVRALRSRHHKET